jgi:hypothetical protein
VETKEASKAGVQETAKLLATRFERQPEDTRAPHFYLWPLGLLLFVNKLVLVSIE